MMRKDLAPGLGAGWEDGTEREEGRGAAREKPGYLGVSSGVYCRSKCEGEARD